MSAKTDTDYLLDMLSHAEHAVAFVEGRTYADLASDQQFNFALQHCFLVIGEAASHISETTRCRISGIAWKQIVGMRQWVVHRYDRVDNQVLWKAATEDVPDLISQILEFLPPEHT